jgi:hypothetical protein
VSAVLKYCDSLVKGFSTSVSVLLAMVASSLLFGFTLTRPFAIGSAVVCCSFYLYFGPFNQRLLRMDEVDEESGGETTDTKSPLLKPSAGAARPPSRSRTPSSGGSDADAKPEPQPEPATTKPAASRGRPSSSDSVGYLGEKMQGA